MVKDKALIKETISLFIEEVERHYEVETVILFGSWVKGTADEYSDIDLAVIAPEFGNNRLKEAQFLSKIAWEVDVAIEAIPYPVDEYNSVDTTCFLYKIIQDGEVVYSKAAQKISR